MGETVGQVVQVGQIVPFSILERIDVGETVEDFMNPRRAVLFQYPRTDRRG